MYVSTYTLGNIHIYLHIYIYIHTHTHIYTYDVKKNEHHIII